MRAPQVNVSRTEAGYASMSVAGLMAALSLLAIGYSNLSISQARKLSAQTAVMEKDIAIEGLFHQTAARLSARRTSIENRWLSKNYQGHRFQIRLSFENTKVNLNRASTDVVAEKLKESMDSTAAIRLAARLTAKQSRAKTPYPEPESFISAIDGAISYACLRQDFTVYRSPATLNRRRTGAQLFAEDGAIVRIEIRSSNETIPRSLDAIILLTGKPADPVWVLDWQRGSNFEEEACPKDA